MIKLKCEKCGNKNKFIATCLYKYLVNSKGEWVTPIASELRWILA